MKIIKLLTATALLTISMSTQVSFAHEQGSIILQAGPALVDPDDVSIDPFGYMPGLGYKF